MKRIIAAALVLPLLAAPAAAQDVTKSYIQVHGGIFYQTGDALSVDTFGPADEPVSAEFDLDPDMGFAVGGLIGYEIALGLSVEADVTFRANDVSLDGPAEGPDVNLGEEETVTFMINGVYTFQVPLLADPYVGVGVGYLTPLGASDDFDGAFAYQAKAGLAWPVGLGQVITEVAYLGSEDLETDDAAFDAELDYGGITGLVGYRFAF